MTWGEAYRLTSVLLDDPSSQVAAARWGWEDGPRTYEWFLLADLFDLEHRKAAKNPEPYPRPNAKGRRRGHTALSRAEVLAVLNAHGHTFGKESHG